MAGAAHLVKVVVEVVNGRLAIAAKVDDPAALHDQRAVEEGERVGRRAMDGGADCDAALHQAPHDRDDLHAAQRSWLVQPAGVFV